MASNTKAVVLKGPAGADLASGLIANSATTNNLLALAGVREYLATPPTMTNAQVNTELSDVNGFDQTNLGTLISGENQTLNRLMTQPSNSSAVMNTQTTTTHKTGAGIFAGFLISTPLANGTLKIYDNTAASGTVLVDTITYPATLLSTGPMFFKCDASFTTGLTAIIGGANLVVSFYWV